MNIWLINPFDELPGEGPEQRYACLARHLAARGHAVTWITADFHHRTKKARHAACGVTEGNTFSSGPAGASPVRAAEDAPFFGIPAVLLLLPAPPYRANTSLQRLRSHRIWARNVRAHLLQQVKTGGLPAPDLLLASTPPLEGAAAAVDLGKALGARVIVDIMDLWPENWLTLLPRFPGARALGRVLLTPWFRLARRVFREADALSAQSHAFGEHAVEKRSEGRGQRSASGNQKPAPPPHICPLGANPAPPPDLQPPTSDLSILYLGAMGRFYDLETVLQTMRLAKNAGHRWELTLAGIDPEDRWQTRARELDLQDRVRFPGFLQREDLRALLRASHIGLIPMNPASGVAVPYKAGDYLAHGLPVVSSLPGELDALLTDTGAGRRYRFGDAKDLFRALRELAASPESLAQARLAAAQLFERHFNREITYPRWAEWMEQQK